MSSVDIEYRKYLSLISQRKFLFAGVAALVCTLGIVIGYLLPAKYEAKSTVFIEKSLISDLVKGIAVTQSIEDRLKVLTHMLASRNLLERVVQELDVDLVGDPGNAGRLIRDFQKNTQVTISGDDLFIIQYPNTNPRLARDYVNTLIQKYIESSLAVTRQDSYGANRFLSEQMEHFRSRIKEAEHKLDDFKQKHPYVAVDDSLLAGEMRLAQQAIDELEVEKSQLQAQVALLNRGAVQGGTSAEHLAELQRRRDQLLLLYTENYPEVLLVNAEIEQIKQELARPRRISAQVTPDNSMQGSLAGIQLNAVVARQEKLSKSIEQKQAILAALPEQRKIYNELLRDRDTYKFTYDQLVLRYGQSELSKQMEIQDKADTFRIVDPAIIPDKPMSPNRIPIILLSLGAGLAAAFALIATLDYFDNSVRTIDGVQELGLPLLALIPRYVSPEEMQRERQQGLVLTACVAAYLLGVFGVLTYEVLQLIDLPAVENLFRRAPSRIAGWANIILFFV